MPRDGREELAGHADGDEALPVTAGEVEARVEFETASVFTALAREDPEVCAQWARMAEGGGKGFGVEGENVAQVDLEVVDAFLEVAMEDGKGRALRARLARRRGGLKPGQPDMLGYNEGDCFGGDGGVLRLDRRQRDIIRDSYAFRA